MVSKRNQKVLQEKHSDRLNKFSLRRLKVGVASVVIGTGLLFSSQVTLGKVAAAELGTDEVAVVIGEEAALVVDPVEEVVAEDLGPVIETEHVESEIFDIEMQTLALVDDEEIIEVAEADVAVVENEGLATEVPAETEAEEVIETLTFEETVEPVESLVEEVTEATADPVMMTFNTQAEVTPIEEGSFRLHFAGLAEEDLGNLGLWIWEDVETPSEQMGGWPNGAMDFVADQRSEYGYYLDFRMLDGVRDKINFLINNSQGDNITGDRSIDIVSQAMNEAWVDVDYNVFAYEPLAVEDTVRVNYLSADEDYEGLKLWSWGDVANPDTALENFTIGQNGAYFDVSLGNLDDDFNFLFFKGDWDWQTGDYGINNQDIHSQVFVREGDTNVYVNPHYVSQLNLNGARQTASDELRLSFGSVEGMTENDIENNLIVMDAEGNKVDQFGYEFDMELNQLVLTGGFSSTGYTVSYGESTFDTLRSWQYTDELYAYDGDLGVALYEDGTAEMTLWSPSADQISVVLYDREDPEVEVGRYEMARGDGDRAGVWNVLLDESLTGLDSHRGYFYHYEIDRAGEKVLVLDPYAPSLAAWNQTADGARIAKAAIVDPSTLGPELDYAEIPGFEKREDAIIYEVHVRDFTSDFEISDELEARFGTFAALVEKLDYVQQLGVTHIQLLPVMSYYFANEMITGERELDWSSTDNNYNWGYDPQSYFALTGMYSENPSDPEQRIVEFKNLINEIHKRGMGVTLDVVYNHTAQVHLFEDLEPNYYHFMNADGSPRESFGGGRLGTTHEMARRVLVDSITYWVEEYKVDGFRFDMMGDHDAESIQMAYDRASALNPNLIMIGEGWITYAGDESEERPQSADQLWMEDTEAVGVFSDEIRNELKSGFGHEGQPMFLTGGAREIWKIFNNIAANPDNFYADTPGDVVQYIEAHDNLTLYDVIAQSIKKDPALHDVEIHKRLRLGNTMILTSQGTSFIHAGQEYGRTKQYLGELIDGEAPYKSTYMEDQDGNPFENPYFVHDSYDSSDMVNRFEWDKVTNENEYLENIISKNYTQGLMYLRRSTDAFTYGTREGLWDNIELITDPNMTDDVSMEDLLIGYQIRASNGDLYAVFVNADDATRTVNLSDFRHLGDAVILVDGMVAGTNAITNPFGVELGDGSITLAPLTSAVIALRKYEDELVVADGLVTAVGAVLDYAGAFAGLPEGAEIGQVLIPANTSEVGTSLALVEILFADGTTRALTIEVTVVADEVVETPIPGEDEGESGEVEVPEVEMPEEEGSEEGDLGDGEEVEEDDVETELPAEELDVVQSSVAMLPETGENDNSLALFSVTSLSILTGLGMIVRGKKKEEE